MHLCAKVIGYIVVYVHVYLCPLHRSCALLKLSVCVCGLILLFTQTLKQRRQPHEDAGLEGLKEEEEDAKERGYK